MEPRAGTKTPIPPLFTPRFVWHCGRFRWPLPGAIIELLQTRIINDVSCAAGTRLLLLTPGDRGPSRGGTGLWLSRNLEAFALLEIAQLSYFKRDTRELLSLLDDPRNDLGAFFASRDTMGEKPWKVGRVIGCCPILYLADGNEQFWL